MLSSPAPGPYTLTVIPSYLFISARPQHYSLVVLGAINSTLDSPYNPVYATTPPTLSTLPPPEHK
jgi:hypothetical protein